MVGAVMISKFVEETFGKSVYPTLVITERKGRFKIDFLPNFSSEYKSLFKLYGSQLVSIVTNNPKKVDSIQIDRVKYYFATERVRRGFDIYFGVYILYAVIAENENLFRDFSIPNMLYDTYCIRTDGELSANSEAVVEKIRKNTAVNKFILDFLGAELDGFFEGRKESYFYKINDVIKYTVYNYFHEDICPRKIKVNYIESDMYTQMNLNDFMFFVVNLLLIAVKYSTGCLNIDFSNNLTTLNVELSGKFVSGFFENNCDILREENELVITPDHPAFSDFEFAKRLANIVGVSMKLENLCGDEFRIGIVISKIDIVFSNLLRARELEGDALNVTVYTVDIDKIINGTD